MDKSKNPASPPDGLNAKPTDDSLLHDLDNPSAPNPKVFYIIGILIIIAGIASGHFLSKNKSLTSGSLSVSNGGLPGKKVVGSSDTSTFKDMAEGTLQKGGINGEGTHKLIRPGGDSQTVYLTSTILDLDQFVGKKIRVWGQTNAAKTAGWLMDVGRVEVI